MSIALVSIVGYTSNHSLHLWKKLPGLWILSMRGVVWPLIHHSICNALARSRELLGSTTPVQGLSIEVRKVTTRILLDPLMACINFGALASGNVPIDWQSTYIWPVLFCGDPSSVVWWTASTRLDSTVRCSSQLTITCDEWTRPSSSVDSTTTSQTKIYVVWSYHNFLHDLIDHFYLCIKWDCKYIFLQNWRTYFGNYTNT